ALSHLNGLYSIGLLGIWLLIDHGWRAPIKRESWIVAAGGLILVLPYGAYCLQHKDTYIAQWNLFSKGRENGTTAAGIAQNLSNEPKRYLDWQFGLMFEAKNRALPFFQAFTVIALVYLLAYAARSLWRREWNDGKSRILLLTGTVWCALFFASIVTNKTHSYLPHLTTWFALSIGVAGSDLISKLTELRRSSKPQIRTASLIAMGVLAVVGVVYLYGAILLTAKYDKNIRALNSSVYDKTVTFIKE